MTPKMLLLGPVGIRHGGTTIALRGAKPRAFLATLLLNANQPVSRDSLIEVMWNGRPPPSATANIRSYASQVRRAAVLALPSGPERLVTGQTRYLLRVEPGELDVDVFDSLAGQGREALRAGQFPRAVELCTRALTHWRGRAGEDVPRVAGLGQQLAALDERRLATREDQMEALLALGEMPAVVAGLRALVAEHPCRERAWRLLMVALNHAGDVAGALDAYLDARAALVGRLGVEPSAELRRLHRAILSRDPALVGATLRFPDAAVACPVLACPVGR